MATQPLETISEETTAPQATPPARVTADLPKTKPATEKNPGRVASGKRLAERNRLAREAKKKAKATKQTSTSATQSNAASTTQSGDTNTESSSSGTIVTILGIGGLVVSALGVYYQREAIMQRLKPAPPAPTPAPPAPTPAPPAPTPAPSLSPVKRGIRGME